MLLAFNSLQIPIVSVQFPPLLYLIDSNLDVLEFDVSFTAKDVFFYALNIFKSIIPVFFFKFFV